MSKSDSLRRYWENLSPEDRERRRLERVKWALENLKGKKRSPETRAKISEANRQRSEELKRSAISKAHARIRELSAMGEWNPTKGMIPWNLGLTKETSEIIARDSDRKRGRNNPTRCVINGQTHKDRVTKTREMNGTVWPSGRECPAWGNTWGRGFRTIWHLDSRGNLIRFRSTWEGAFAVYLEYSGVKYEYEPTTFDLGWCSYTPDFHLIDKDVWIEVKGYWRDGDREKVRDFSQLGHTIFVVDGSSYQDLELDRFRRVAIDQHDRLVELSNV